MDWILSSLEGPCALDTPADELSPASPSVGASDAPGFALRRARAARDLARALQPLALLPPLLRFPEPRVYWTA